MAAVVAVVAADNHGVGGSRVIAGLVAHTRLCMGAMIDADHLQHLAHDNS